MKRVVLIGATGAFGSRLAAMLAARADIELVLAARRTAPLDLLRDQLRRADARAEIRCASFDRNAPARIADLAPWLVIDASGPFQTDDYALAAASIDASAHYIDLADARGFVAGFAAVLDGSAKTRGVLAASGASSTPSLSHAALETLVAGWRRIDDVTVAICPGAQATIGLSVVQAILSYAGRPVRIRDAGWREAPGWSGARKIMMPGLGARWVSLCETPDLDLLPANFPIRRSAEFGAGLELALLHLGLAALALVVRIGLMRSLVPLARPLRVIAVLLQRFGSDCGGMIVTACGVDADGRAVKASWSLVAEHNAGPNVPASAAAALTGALLDNRSTARGAQPAVGLLTLDDILAQLADLPIATRTTVAWPDEASLFRRLLGPRFNALPDALRVVHAGTATMSFEGRAVARMSRHPLANLASRIIGLPKRGPQVCRVTIAPDASGETWTRRFGTTSFHSRLASSTTPGTFTETFGPLRFGFDMIANESGVTWRLTHWRVLGLTLPLWGAPRIRARARQDGARYRFAVIVAHRWIGVLFAYRGTLLVP